MLQILKTRIWFEFHLKAIFTFGTSLRTEVFIQDNLGHNEIIDMKEQFVQLWPSRDYSNAHELPVSRD